MKNRLSLSFIIVCSIFLCAWVIKVQPLPDKDSLLKLYWPIIKSLDRAQTESVFKTSLEEFTGDYPSGPAFIPIFFHLIGLGDNLIQNPSIYFIIPFLLFLTFLTVYPQKDKLIWLGLFLFPVTQICLKDYSPHSLILFLHLIGGFSFFQLIKGKSKKYLVLSAISLWYSMTIKHVGIIYFLALLGAAVISSFRRFSLRFWLGSIVLLLLALPFYPINGSIEYWYSTKQHNSYQNDFDWIWISLSIIIFLSVSIKHLKGTKHYTKRFPAKLVLPFSILCILLILSWLSYNSLEENALTRSVILAFIGMSLCIKLVDKLQLNPIASFLFLWPALHFCIDLTLYSSWLARINHLILGPAIVLFACGSLRLIENRKRYFVITGILFGLSNFFPKTWLESRDSQAILGPTLVHNLFNGHHINYLGWNDCLATKQRQSVKKILKENFIFSEEKEITTIALGFHPSREMLFHFPLGLEFNSVRFTRIDDWSYQRAKSLKDDLINSNFTIDLDLLHKYSIGLILVIKDSLFEPEDVLFDLKEASLREVFHSNQFLLALKNRLRIDLLANKTELSINLKKLQNVKIDDELFAILVPPPLNKKIQKVKQKYNQPKSLSNTEDKNDSKIEFQMNKRKAGELFLRSNEYFEKDPNKCIEILLEVLTLDPQHTEAKKDLIVLRKHQEI